jgi:hypothetical protein
MVVNEKLGWDSRMERNHDEVSKMEFLFRAGRSIADCVYCWMHNGEMVNAGEPVRHDWSYA